MSDLIDKANQIVETAIEQDLARQGVRADGHGGFRAPGSDPGQAVVDRTVARYADVPGLFEPFTWCPKGGDFEAMAGGMLTTLQKLAVGTVDTDPVTLTPVVPNPNLAEVGTDPSTFRTVVESQFVAAAVLKGCLEAEDAMWAEVARSIEQIADRTLLALDGTGGTAGSGPGSDLTVSTAVAARVVRLPSGAEVMAVAATEPAAPLVSGDARLPLGSDSAPVVVARMREAIERLKQQIVETESRIARAAREMGDLVESASVNRLQPVRPQAAGR